jgi:hypothetical protein
MLKTSTLLKKTRVCLYDAFYALKEVKLTLFSREKLCIVFCPHNDGFLEKYGKRIDAEQWKVQHDPLSHKGVLRLSFLQIVHFLIYNKYHLLSQGSTRGIKKELS